MKRIFFQRTTLSSSFFLLFPTFEVLCFLPLKTFQRNSAVWHAVCSNFGNFNGFEKNHVFSDLKHLYFFKQDPCFERFEDFLCFRRILRQKCSNLVRKTFQIQKIEQECRYERDRNWQTSRKICSFSAVWVKIFAPIFHRKGAKKTFIIMGMCHKVRRISKKDSRFCFFIWLTKEGN